MKTKTIMVPIGKTGKKRSQLVQILQSGKFKFIKNVKKAGSKAKRVGSKIKSKAKRKGSGKKSGNTNKKANGSHRSGMKQTFLTKAYPKKDVKTIAGKGAIGATAGVLVRVGTMFFPQPIVREIGSRVANAISSYFGGGTGNSIYQVADATLSRVILLNRSNGNGNGGVTVPNPLGGGA